MRWRYWLKEHSKRVYVYEYAREDDPDRGEIIYDSKTGRVSVVRPCGSDKNSKIAREFAEQHFWKVIRESFPPEVYVCCG